MALEAKYHENVDVVYDGFDFDSGPSKSRTSNVGEIRFGMCSRLSYQKGVDTYCDLALTFSSNENFLFYHAGGLPMLESSDAYISRLALKHINSINWCDI